MDVKVAYKILTKKFPDYKVIACGDMGDKYVFNLRPKDADPEELYLGTSYTVDKKTRDVAEFSMMMNPEGLARAKVISVNMLK